MTRHEVILLCISQYIIRTQAELLETLNNHGHKVTQATLSRDCKQLGLVKINGAQGYRYQQLIKQEQGV